MSQTFPQAHRRPCRSSRPQIISLNHRSFDTDSSPTLGIAVACLLALSIWTLIIFVGRTLW